MSRKRREPVNPWKIWSQINEHDWRRAMMELALDVAIASGEIRNSDLDHALAELRASDPRLAGRIADEINNLRGDDRARAGLIGYCLGRTMPAGVEHLADWPRRALEMAGFGSDEEMEEESPGVA